ncbi:ATP synthase F1 subunit delta [Anthocerotibacter panamensis]|uniref:ATP synthase F1 subunit delta n=1 Tax=Anthocerotibacter panamensis TaxID=2857077 RepID=UPI001C401C4A|nr:ATP synthase F1 subunit delta [Anthocerotibacter panamensis]
MRDSKLGQRVAQRYAEALRDLGNQNNLLDRFGADFTLIEAVLREEPLLAKFLASPVIDAQNKKDLLTRAFNQNVHPYTLNFLMLLVDRRRAMYLEVICQTFQKLLRELAKTALAEVASAVPLTPEQEEHLKARLVVLTKASRVELVKRVDPDLLGGLVVRFGDQVIDVSLRGQLRRLALQLSAS